MRRTVNPGWDGESLKAYPGCSYLFIVPHFELGHLFIIRELCWGGDESTLQLKDVNSIPRSKESALKLLHRYISVNIHL